jgi:long-chain acyl-CoA synthetase
MAAIPNDTSRTTTPRNSASPQSTPPRSGQRDAGFRDATKRGPGPDSLVDLLAESVVRHADRPLFLSKTDGLWRETTYGEFAARVDALRAALFQLGVGPGDRVGIIAGNSVAWAVVAYAAYGLGAAIVPMYEAQHEAEVAFIVRDSSLKLLFVENLPLFRQAERLRDSIPTLEHVVLLSGVDAPLNYEALLERGRAAPIPAIRPAPSVTAALLYTSGTTGEPKGVVLSHANILANVVTMREVMAATEERPEEHRSLSFLPWAHAFGHTSELHGSISAGASMAIAESIDKIVENIQEVRPSVLVAVPRVFLRLYNGALHLVSRKPAPVRWLFRRGLEAAKKKNRGEPLRRREAWVLRVADRIVFSRVRGRLGGRLKYAISGAAALSRDVAEFVDAIGIVVYEGYGLTETSPIATANVPGQRKLGSVGRPIPGVRVVIERALTGDPGHGEIVIYGDNVMRGYHNREADTRSVFTEDGGFRTGDLGYLDEDGYLFITGRIKEQYKLANGKYVVPSPLEEQLKVSPFIANALIYGENEPHNVALIVLEPAFLRDWADERGLDAETLEGLTRHPKVKEKLREELDRLSSAFKGYERIRSFSLLAEDFTQENGMLTPSLKLKRRNVIDRYRSELRKLYEPSSQ